MTLSARELDILEAVCREVPSAANTYLASDAASALVETVVDYQRHTTAVVRAMRHYSANHGERVRTVMELGELLEAFPADRQGNVELARHLWGYDLRTRAEQLRGLVAFFRSKGIDDLDGLRRWAGGGTFAEFEGRVKGLGPAVYQWLVMRLGVETVKPDVRVLRFVRQAIGRAVSERETVDAISTVARRMGIKPNELDWAIWESMASNTAND